MSRSHRRPSNYSRQSSPRIDHSLSVTEASFSNLGLNETAGAQHLSVPSTYQPIDPRRRRPSNLRSELSSDYLATGYDTTDYLRATSPGSYSDLQPSTAFGPSLLDPEDYQLYPEAASYSSRASPFSSNDFGGTTMSNYSYPQENLPSYRDSLSYAPTSKPPSNRGYTSETSLSRSMSGPFGPSILPSSAYAGFRVEEREIARQRRRNIQESRRRDKLRLRMSMLPSISDAGPSEVIDMSSSIDFLAAHSGASYDSHSAYARTPSTSSTHATYPIGVSAPTYHNTYPATYAPTSTLYSSPPTASGLSSTSIYPNYRNDRRSSTNPEPVVLEAPKKPQCWDHGCNGRQFSTFSNLLRHQREKSGTSQKSICHRCGAEFTRKTARDGHLAHDKCKPRPDR